MKLEGRTALVTGAGKGIGDAIARALVSEGARLAVCGRNMEPLENLAAELGPGHIALHCDVTEESQISETVDKAVARFGALDILVNNAGIARWLSIEETTTEYFDLAIATNLRAPFLFSRRAWPALQASKGQILNVSSIAGFNAYARMSAYCASKWGLNGLTEVLEIEGQPHGIRVMALCPGSVDTDIWGSEATGDERARMMTPAQVADLALWLLASPRSVLVKSTIIENFRDPF